MRFLVILLAISFFSCQKNTRDDTYLGGQIINPLDSIVTIHHNNTIIDSISVNKDGSFQTRLNIANEGIYTFSHLPEWQLLYLNPSDSLAFRVNTKDFDESLTFSGTSAVENNFLINMYLMNEKNDDLILSYYKIHPKTFAHKTDSLKTQRIKQLNDLNKKYEFSEYFLNVAQKSILFEYYDMRERYAFLIRKYFPERSHNISDQFFSYRNEVDFNDESMLFHIGYMRFLDNFLKNKSIEHCELQNKSCFTLNSFSNIKDRLALADSIFTNTSIKNKFHKRLLEEEILLVKNKNQLAQVKKIIDDCQLSVTDKEDLKSSANLQSYFLEGRYVGNESFITSGLSKTKIIDLIDNRPLVVTTWSSYSSAYLNLRKSILSELKLKYPEIKFVGLNIGYLDQNQWVSNLKKFNLDVNSEFSLEISESELPNKKYLNNHINRLFMITKKGYLKFSNVSFSDRNLESKLLQLLN
ncbi:hypothetical protein [Psychroflexus sp. ALD_RP9]|uniref:hypothetical protein n=1 Tax=Psychroflexus sp. ALD_RP9 TaxID=2777186 RepID=UPI001A8EBADE|nr:hypothetical protein [Psychroflexus sp. ALD_RP9]QSS96771.1 hypothetical protein IMZ30_10010 [Psychroflexus sp. ALD_RP9]